MMALMLEGKEVASERSSMVRAAFSRLSLPTALPNVTGKSLVPKLDFKVAPG
jgi:hypothetical protein